MPEHHLYYSRFFTRLSNMSLLYDQFDRDDPCLFADACERNDLMGVKELLQHKPYNYPANINSHVDSRFGEEISGYTPLHFAVKYKNSDVLIYLLKKGADITKRSADSWSPLHLAYYTSNDDSVHKIFEHSEVNTYKHVVDRIGLTHFHICCAMGLPAFIDSFITNGTYVNCSVSLLADKNAGFTPLHFAVQNGHTLTAKLLLENGANLQMKCTKGLTPLHVACERSDLSTVEVLLTYDHYLTALMTKDNEGLIPLHVACKNSNLSVVELLLTYDADLNTLKTKDNEGRTALHHAAKHGNVSIVEILIEKGASIRTPDNKNQNPFDVAVFTKQYEVFDAMLPQCKNEDGTPVSFSAIFDLDDFYDACSRGDLKDIKRFLKHGFSVNSHAGSSRSSTEIQFRGYTPLHFAVKKERLDIVTELLENGADITRKNDYGKTPVHMAYEKKLDQLIIRMFNQSESYSPYVNVANENGLTHLHICCTVDVPNVLEKFIMFGADINIQTLSVSGVFYSESGFTPLHYAVRCGLPSMVEVLLRNGADLSVRSATGLTPLHLLCNYDENKRLMSVADLFLRYGADFMIKDNQNRLPLYRVFYRNANTSLVNFLLDNMPTDHNFADSQNLSILHIACFQRNRKIVKRLLNQGCCPNDRVTLNKNRNLRFGKGILCSGITPLHIALYVTDPKIAKQLLLAGADINAKDEKGNSPLAYIYKLGLSRITDTEFESDEQLIDELLFNHVTKLDAAELYVSTQVKEELRKRDIPSTSDVNLVKRSTCITELEEIQSVNVDGYANGILRRIINKNVTEMSRLVENENLRTFLNPGYLDILVEEFPLYGFMIKVQVKKGLKRAEKVRKAKVSLKSLTSISLPHLCSELIFDYLSDEHLENLIDANIVLQKKD